METPLQDLQPMITPSESFFIRSHFPTPKINTRDWMLCIEADKAVFKLSLKDLQKMPQETITATLECAGNGRNGFPKRAEGEILWGDGAVGNAAWTGVPLRYILREKCKLSSASGSLDCKTIFFEGSDIYKSLGRSGKSPRRFVRYLGIKKALDKGTIIALRMNGRPLPKEHGFPARLIVPGWYAMASVKWLSKITLSEESHPRSFFNDSRYVYKSKGPSSPVTDMRVKSLITNPLCGQRLARGETTTVSGKAWSGSGCVVRVELRIDGRCFDAEISKRTISTKYAWIAWRKDWTPKKSGDVAISVRATDSGGNDQPDLPFGNVFQYGYNAPNKIIVKVS